MTDNKEIRSKIEAFEEENHDLFMTKPFIIEKNNVAIHASRIKNGCLASLRRRIALNIQEIKNAVSDYSAAVDTVVKMNIEEDTKLLYLAAKQDAIAIGAMMEKRNLMVSLEGLEIIDKDRLSEMDAARLENASPCPQCKSRNLVVTFNKKLGTYSILCASCGHFYNDQKIPVDTAFSAITVWNTMNIVREDEQRKLEAERKRLIQETKTAKVN